MDRWTTTKLRDLHRKFEEVNFPRGARARLPLVIVKSYRVHLLARISPAGTVTVSRICRIYRCVSVSPRYIFTASFLPPLRVFHVPSFCTRTIKFWEQFGTLNISSTQFCFAILRKLTSRIIINHCQG